MTPDRCGTARVLASLPEADRRVVDEFRRWLRGDVDYDPDSDMFVPAGTGVNRNQTVTGKEQS